MQSVTKTIAATTTLSIFLHGVVFAAILFAYERVDAQAEGVGKSIDIRLVSAIMDSEQQETDTPRKRQAVQKILSESPVNTLIHRSARDIITSQLSEQTILPAERDDKSATVQKKAAMQKTVVVSEADSSAPRLQSTRASSQKHSILELLHARINNNKKYPYMARRQRREGVATIAFVLHPDGKIEDAHLLKSSRTRALDRAALSAVRQIEPFDMAHDYLRWSEKFQVDVEFNLL